VSSPAELPSNRARPTQAKGERKGGQVQIGKRQRGTGTNQQTGADTNLRDLYLSPFACPPLPVPLCRPPLSLLFPSAPICTCPPLLCCPPLLFSQATSSAILSLQFGCEFVVPLVRAIGCNCPDCSCGGNKSRKIQAPWLPQILQRTAAGATIAPGARAIPTTEPASPARTRACRIFGAPTAIFSVSATFPRGFHQLLLDDLEISAWHARCNLRTTRPEHGNRRRGV
jgi:hypothetical protein